MSSYDNAKQMSIFLENGAMPCHDVLQVVRSVSCLAISRLSKRLTPVRRGRMWFPVPTTSSPSKRLVPRLRHHRETHEIQQSAICVLKISNSLRELHLPPYGRKTNPSCFPDGELPYHTILNHTILYYTVLYSTIPNYTVLYCSHMSAPRSTFQQIYM
jgi:hypothetical protein